MMTITFLPFTVSAGDFLGLPEQPRVLGRGLQTQTAPL